VVDVVVVMVVITDEVALPVARPVRVSPVATNRSTTVCPEAGE